MAKNANLYDKDDLFDYDDDEDDTLPSKQLKAKSNSKTKTKTKIKNSITFDHNAKLQETELESKQKVKAPMKPPVTSSLTKHPTSTISSTDCVVPSSTDLFSDDEITSEETECSSFSNVSVVIAGHVDAGKSTLTGNLLYQLGLVNKKSLRKLENQSKDVGKNSCSFAWVVDDTQSERERGATINLSERFVNTGRRWVRVVDSPGHKDFVPAMIAGSCLVDAAVLVVPATAGEYESSMSPLAQTQEHAQLLKALGVERLIVAVNKMDNTHPSPWSQDRYSTIVTELLRLLLSLEYKENNIVFVPLSGFSGENLVSLPGSDHPLLSWYEGGSLVDALNTIEVAPHNYKVNSLRAVITNVSIDNTGNTVDLSLIILNGKLSINRSVAMLSNGFKYVGIVKLIKDSRTGEAVTCSNKGDSVFCALKMRNAGTLTNLGITEGMCIYKGPNQLNQCTAFEATIHTLPNLSIPVLPGSSFILHCHGVECESVLRKIMAIENRTRSVSDHHSSSGKLKLVPGNSTAVVEISLRKPLAIDIFDDFPPLGRFVLRFRGQSIATGKCSKIL